MITLTMGIFRIGEHRGQVSDRQFRAPLPSCLRDSDDV
jgi:hypothetical protein